MKENMNYCKMYFLCLMLVSNVVTGVFTLSDVTVKAATYKLGENALMELTYTLQSGESLLYVSWYKSNECGEQQGRRIVTNVNGYAETNGKYSLSSDADLMIASVTVEDTGYYSCQVYTNSGNGSGFNFLRVYYLWTPTLVLKENTFLEKETIIFTCRLADGIPTPITNTWIKDGGVLVVSDTEKYPQSDTTLEIKRVNEIDLGVYQCRAENSAYSGIKGKLSNTKKLSILVRPAIHATGENASIKLSYKTQPGESFLYLSWFKSNAAGEATGDAITTNIGGNAEPNGRYSLSSDGDLMIASVTVDDTGYYRCEVYTTSGPNYGYNLLTVNNCVCSSTSSSTSDFVASSTSTSDSDFVSSSTSTPALDFVALSISTSDSDFVSSSTSTPALDFVSSLTSTPALDSCTSLVVGMTFLGIVIGIVLSSSAFGIYLKTRTSSSKAPEAMTNERQAGTYMEYRSEQTTKNQTYDHLNKNDDKQVVYINVKSKKKINKD